jgi:hypothetical protein
MQELEAKVRQTEENLRLNYRQELSGHEALLFTELTRYFLRMSDGLHAWAMLQLEWLQDPLNHEHGGI